MTTDRPGSITRQRAAAIAAGVVALVAIAVGLTRVQIDTGVDAFVPADDPTLVATSKVADSFGGDPIVVLLESKEPRQLLSKTQVPALLRLEGKLAALDHVAAAYGPATVLNQIAGQAQDLMAELIGMRDGMQTKAEQDAKDAGRSKAEIEAAGKAATAEFDERYLPLITQGLPGGLPTLHNDKFVQNAVFNADGDPRPQWDFVVPTASSVAILLRPDQDLDQSEVEQLVDDVESVVGAREVTGATATIAGVPTIVAALGDRVRSDVALLGGLAVLGVGAWFLGVAWTARRWRLVPLATSFLGTAVTLAVAGWAGVSMSLGVVAFLPVLLGVGSDFMVYLITGVSRRLVVAAAAATSASFAALAVTPLATVRQLGWALALGVLVTLAVSLVVRRWMPVENSGDVPPPAPPIAPLWMRGAAALVAVAVAAVGWVGLPDLRLEADFRSLASNLRAYDDAQHVEQVLGSSGEITIALSGSDTVSPEALTWMDEVESRVATRLGDQMRLILSPSTLLSFLGDAPTADQLAAGLRLLPTYLSSSVIRSDHQMAVMTFGVRLDDAEALQALRAQVRDLLPTAPPGTTVDLVGLPLVAVSTYETLSSARYRDAGLGIVAAGLVLALVLRRRRDALLAVAAASLATGIVLVGMRILDLGLNPITAAVGSLAAAVACEFTVVLAATRRSTHQPVLLAAAASATGYGVLALSGLSIVGEFGVLLAVTVVVAAGAAHLVVWVTRRSPEKVVE